MVHRLAGLILTLVLPTLITSLLQNCQNFTPKCICGQEDYYGKHDQYIVNCTNTGFTDAKILENLPSETQVLIFSGNKISTLPWNVFGTMNNHSELRVIDMSNNGIKEIRGKSYHHVPNVERLILNHNEISIATSEPNNHHHPRVFSNFDSLSELHLTNAFADNTSEDLAADLHDIFINSELRHLNKLHLEQNEITGFRDPNVFCSLPNLMDLHLGDNLLRDLHFNLSCLEHLRFLDLERNQVMALKDADLAVLDSFPQRHKNLAIDLSGNPFVCGHEMEHLCAWLRVSQVRIRNKNAITCTTSNSINTDKHTEGHSDCLPHTLLMTQVQPPSSHTLVTFVLTALTVVLLSLVCLLLYVNRDQISYQLRPVIDSVTRKVQYTSIGKQEEHEMVL
ncbi:unnamed protein product [Bemisia tabaci]|uniref:Trophoblast glycoprotein n=1 Tax=Bemisia tabaci TaxID=7038 RepID=A0A9P0A4T8_BEMTA|nr:unnamed protein product [Bemisia tabaci]